ncbi:type I restriction endonuclease subunit R [Candidatus Neomarinimicrobiota bacterium]
MKQHTEAAFESAIEFTLLGAGANASIGDQVSEKPDGPYGAAYIKGDPENFDRERALDPTVLLSFIQRTQPDEWTYLENLHKEKAGDVLLDDLVKALASDHEGCLKVLRHGFKCFGKLFKVAYFAPASSMNPDMAQKYAANRLTVTRQLKYSTKNENSLDLVISLNGLPLITMELKNPMTGQNWRHAVTQYRKDRDAKELIFQFKKRTLVHFAVDPHEAYMTTQLKGPSTFFLPFNKGNNHGAGNPDNPDGYKTAYLWEEVLQRDSLMDILARFIHLQVEEKKISGKKLKKETMIFPRYHQLDSVRAMIADVSAKGVGHEYLIQHSAGSGKSNSIAWLAHRLATLHNEQDEKIFDSVIVVTDRLVLDQQLQNTIYQFEHRQGVVEKIDEDSTQLADALKTGTPIVITTMQKFPYVTEKVGELPSRKYAVIIDEAHSSQGGETATEMKAVLGDQATLEREAREADGPVMPDYEDEILKTMDSRGKQPNLSYFAFTATPKYKTLAVFGRLGPDGKPKEFHLYSMRQAIEEKFILDVLKHYTTYKTYYRLVKSIEDDPEVDKKKAARALARYVSFHPHNIAQKTEVMMEHFMHFTRHKIGGRAKAMVVTSSRLHAVRYKQAFDKYIEQKGYTGVKTLVAFSGRVPDPDIPGMEYTEVGMNEGMKEKELPESFSSDEYQVLLVAEKYQTGFDQPLLHTMYVDKRLAGIQAVQTLSRLNRMHAGKEDTFVLDFVNKPDEILEAFAPYYEQTLVGEEAEARQLYELQAKLGQEQVYYQTEVEEFAKVFYKPVLNQTPADHKKMNACIDPAVSRYKALDDEKQDEFRKVLVAYRNLYAFMSQIIPFHDSDLEKLYAYIRFLLKKLPHRNIGPEYDFSSDVELKFYRLKKMGEGAIDLSSGGEVSGPVDVGTGTGTDIQVPLSQLVDVLNKRFGTKFTIADQLFFDSVREDALADATLRQAAKANTLENFGFVFDKALESLFIDRMEQNEEITAKYMNEKSFKALVTQMLQKQVYEQINEEVT